MTYIEYFKRYKALMKELNKLYKKLEKLKDAQGYEAEDVVKGSSADAPYLQRKVYIRGMADKSAEISAVQMKILTLERELESDIAPTVKEILKFLERRHKKYLLKPSEDGEIKDILILYFVDCVKMRELPYYCGYDEGVDGSTLYKKAIKYLNELEESRKKRSKKTVVKEL